MYWNLIWKSSVFVSFWGKVTHFGLKSGQASWHIVRIHRISHQLQQDKQLECVKMICLFSINDRDSHQIALIPLITCLNRGGRFGPKLDNSGTFSDQISVSKAPDLSHWGPIWPNLEPNLPSRCLNHGCPKLAQIGCEWDQSGTF